MDSLANRKLIGAHDSADVVGRDQAYLNQPWVSARAIRVTSTAVGFLHIDISKKQTQALYQKGYAAAEEFLSTWDWEAYLKRFR